ncbi:hypothetical protein N9574_01795, partial [bacterium]|nr:hypothetical protein [bacterium]
TAEHLVEERLLLRRRHAVPVQSARAHYFHRHALAITKIATVSQRLSLANPVMHWEKRRSA